jgi:hypothetical protein
VPLWSDGSVQTCCLLEGAAIFLEEPRRKEPRTSVGAAGALGQKLVEEWTHVPVLCGSYIGFIEGGASAEEPVIFQHYPNAKDATVGRHLFVRSLKGSRKKRPENVRIHTLDELYEWASTVARAARLSSSMTSPMLPMKTAAFLGSDAKYAVFILI